MEISYFSSAAARVVLALLYPLASILLSIIGVDILQLLSIIEWTYHGLWCFWSTQMYASTQCILQPAALTAPAAGLSDSITKKNATDSEKRTAFETRVGMCLFKFKVRPRVPCRTTAQLHADAL